MTLEEFQKLLGHEQEEFVNSGQQFTAHPSQVLSSPNTVLQAAKPAGLDEGLIALPSPQQAEIYDEEFHFDITDPYELLLIVDQRLTDPDPKNRVYLHKWQIDFMIDFAKGGASDETPFQAAVRACNGSGKDKYIIAACVVWLCMRYRETLGVVTSASGAQLDGQTCFHIKRLCEQVNTKFGIQTWKTNYRSYECLATKSIVKCYATDEAGKAEGFHPIDNKRKMGIFESEAKTVPDDIYIAQNKCTGYTHRVMASTPGEMRGHFFQICSRAVKRSLIKDITEVTPTDYIEYHIKASDCSHLSKNYMEQMKRDLPGGEFGPAYKSQVDAEFGSGDSQTVIPYIYIWKARHKSNDDWRQEVHNTGGLDLSDGGDETVLIVRNGNKVLKVIPFRFDNTEDTILFLDEKFKENGLAHPEALIFADAGGIGKPMLNRLVKIGYNNIRFRDNRHAASYPKTYKNWGTESWFNMSNLFSQGDIILCGDDKLCDQLASRKYKLIGGHLHQLLSKPEQKTAEIPSPDRADAMVLAFSNFKSEFVSKLEDRNKPFEVEEEEKPISEFTQRSKMSKYGPRNIEVLYNVNNGQKDFGDLQNEIAEYNQKVRINNN